MRRQTLLGFLTAAVFVAAVSMGYSRTQLTLPAVEPPPPFPREERWPPPVDQRVVSPVRHRQTPLEVSYQRVQVDIQDQVATVRVRQLFTNHSDRNQEADFLVALPKDASVSDFAYWVGEERIGGEVREKGEARATYERIVARQRDPGLLEEAGRHLFRARVFPIPAGGQTAVELVYTQLLPYDQGTIDFLYPMTGTGQPVTYSKWSMTVRLHDQQPITSVSTPALPAHAQKRDRHGYTLTAEKTNFTPDRDFTLRYKVSSDDFGVRFLTHRTGDDPGYFMLMLAPMDNAPGEVLDKDVVFVFDKSGSMDGQKMEQAKSALSYCVRRLNPGDRFSIVAFSDHVETFSNDLLPATGRNTRDGERFAANLLAEGATDIHQALTTALDMMRVARDRQRTIVFLTDGLPTAGLTEAKAIIDAVGRANRTDTRLFTFGVGDDVDDYLLLQLATANRGAEEDVKTGQSIETKITRFFNKVSMPVLVDLAVAIDGVDTTMVYPATVPDVFQGTQLVMAGRYLDHGRATVRLTGQKKGKPWKYRKTVTFPRRESANDFVPRLWAQDRVDYLSDYLKLTSQNEELRQEIITLGKRHRISTPYTSFLAVPEWEKDAARFPDDCPTCGGTSLRAQAQSPPPATSPLPEDFDGFMDHEALAEEAPARREFRQSKTFGLTREKGESHVDEAYQVLVTDTGDIRAAQAVFPWGGSQPLTRDKNLGRWGLRFDTPAGHGANTFTVTVVLTLKNGKERRVSTLFHAGREAPIAQAWATVQKENGGWTVTVHATTAAQITAAKARLSGAPGDIVLTGGPAAWKGTLRSSEKPAGDVTLTFTDGAGGTYSLAVAL